MERADQTVARGHPTIAKGHLTVIRLRTTIATHGVSTSARTPIYKSAPHGQYHDKALQDKTIVSSHGHMYTCYSHLSSHRHDLDHTALHSWRGYTQLHQITNMYHELYTISHSIPCQLIPRPRAQPNHNHAISLLHAVLNRKLHHESPPCTNEHSYTPPSRSRRPKNKDIPKASSVLALHQSIDQSVTHFIPLGEIYISQSPQPMFISKNLQSVTASKNSWIHSGTKARQQVEPTRKTCKHAERKWRKAADAMPGKNMSTVSYQAVGIFSSGENACKLVM